MFRRSFDVTFPDSHHAVAARLHIGILRLVEGNAFELAMIKSQELGGVAMPIVAIELNHDIDGRHEGVNAEFVTNKVLSFIRNADAVKDGVGDALKVIWLHAELLGIHAAQMQGAIWVFVSALKRAIGNVVFSALGARRRPIKGLAANFASMFGLVAALPFVRTVYGTEAFSVGRGVERDTAYFASNIFARLSVRLGRVAVTLKRAITLVGTHSLRDSLATTFACDGTNCVVFHNYILAQLNQHD